MDINEEIVKFVISARNKLAEYGERTMQLIQDGQEQTKEFEDLMDKTEFLDWVIGWVYDPDYSIVDDDMNPVYNFIDDNDDNILSMLSNWRYLFGLDIYPVSDISLSQTVIVALEEESGTTGTGLPSGGQNTYILTIGSDGNAYWAEPTVYFEVVNF